MSSKHRVVVLKIVSGQLTVTAAAAEYGLSRQYLHKLLARYREDGLAGLEPRSRAPVTSPQQVTDRVRQRILTLRTALVAEGLDAGPVTIAWHLRGEGLQPPSTSTIRRILHASGLIVPEPRKRPRSSYVRFEAAQPNETWQSDFTHWRLADGTDVEILNWLDDHSRMLLSCTAHHPVTGRNVVDTFLACVDDYGPPASTLTDNGRVYTARHSHARNAFEYVLAALNVIQKNGAPNHPQTQGKIERFHQTLKRWLTARPRATTIPQLQGQLDAFRDHYNHRRPHRALAGTTPATAYAASAKAVPAGHPARYRPLPSPLRPRRQQRQDQPPPSRSHAPPRHRRTTTAANAASSSPTTTPPSPSSTSTPARSSPPTPSTPPEPTGETKNESPADGQALVLDVSLTRLRCLLCRDSSHMVASEGFEPPNAEQSDLQSDPFGRLGNSPGAHPPSLSSRPEARLTILLCSAGCPKSAQTEPCTTRATKASARCLVPSMRRSTLARTSLGARGAASRTFS